MLKVKFLKSHPEFGYFPGEKGTLSKENAEKLKETGHVELLGEGANENDLPEDLPGRDPLFENGLTMEQIKAATKNELVKINGIGDKTAEQIIEFVKE